MMVMRIRAVWLTMAIHFPKTIREALSRVSAIISMVLPVISEESAVTPRIGWMKSAAMPNIVKITPDANEPALSMLDDALAERRMKPSRSWKIRNNIVKLRARMPWRSSLTSIGESLSGKSVRWVRDMGRSFE